MNARNLPKHRMKSEESKLTRPFHLASMPLEVAGTSFGRNADIQLMDLRVLYMRIFVALGLLLGSSFLGIAKAQQEEKVLRPFVEYGAAVHTGDYTPLWQVSNRQGLGSLDNNTYLRGGVFYTDQWGKWKVDAGLDVVLAVGMSSCVQQAYADFRYKKLGFFVGSKEMSAPLINPVLSSGELTWSGNSRPIPQVMIGIPDYWYILPRLAIRGEISYGWFTDRRYLEDHARLDRGFWYTKGIKYHHKEGFIRIGVPGGRWQLDLGMTLDTQFGGKMVSSSGETDLGNGLKDYFRAFIPGAGGEDSPYNDAAYFQGNFVGTEQIRGTYRGTDFSISAYLDNYFEDFSAMGKQNGWDGLWGIEMKFNDFRPIHNIVLEYLQTTNQSGPLHGLHEDGEGPVHKVGGMDNYYNNGLYHGWAHAGMANGNPLLRSPLYNEDGNMTFIYNRVKALHVGWSGYVAREWDYVAKLTFNRTWGTYLMPTLDILENFSAYVAFRYVPTRLMGWQFHVSLGADTGEIYGDNLGFQMMIRKTF